MNRFMPIVGVVLAGASAGRAVALAHTAPGRASTASTAAQQLSRRTIPENQTWRRYDEAPASAFVRPIRVLQVTGNVTNPQALAHPASGGATTLRFTSGATPPSLVLDYGKDVGGIATFDIAASSGATLSAAYAEPLYNLGDDGASSIVAFKSGDPQRTKTFSATRSGVLTGR